MLHINISTIKNAYQNIYKYWMIFFLSLSLHNTTYYNNAG